MEARVLLGLAFLTLLWGPTHGQGPPRVSGSYKASGEMVETLEDESGLLTQVTFEESFDAATKDASFRVWVLGMNVTFVENHDTKQTFLYNDTGCQLMTVQEWVTTKTPPSLLAYEDTNGTVRFSLKQLFALDDKLLKTRNTTATFRGIPARKWVYEVRGNETDTGESRVLTVYAFWSEPDWSTTSTEAMVPLGYVVTKTTYHKKTSKRVKVHEQFINVFSFVPNTVDRKLFEPVQGMRCEGRVQTLKFPDVSKITAIAVHSEVVFPDYRDIKYVDVWLDTKSKLYRADMERIKDEEPGNLEKSLKFSSEIAIQKMGVVFKTIFDKGMQKCQVIPFKDYEFDIQNLFNIMLPPNDWNVGKLFGLNSTQYVYTGKTTKRSIPCHVFQGVRTDWPFPEANVTSLWDWCFSINVTQKDKGVMFRNGEYGLVNAQVKVLKSDLPGDIPTGYRLTHHFYHVNARDPGIMDATNFDISRCYEDFEKRRLQMRIDWEINRDTLQAAENATSDRIFLQKWKEALYTYTGLEPHSLRLSQVQAFVSGENFFLKFIILAPHTFLPPDIFKTQKTGFEAENMLRNNVNAGNVSILYTPFKGAQAKKISPVKHSVELWLTKLDPHTTATPPPEKTSTLKSTVPFTIITEPDRTTGGETTPVIDVTTDKTARPSLPTTPRVSGTTPKVPGTTPKDERREKEKLAGHGPGAVAGVSIAMLLVGITVGSAGIFVKFNGLPACLKGAT